MLRVLGVSGSMRADSNSLRIVQAVLEEAAARGAQTRLLDLHEIDLPMFRGRAPRGDHVGQVTADEAVNWAQAFLLVSPDYHGTMSGALKNFLDHYWQEFAGKLFAYGCLSRDKGLTVMDQMRTAVRQCYGWSLPYSISAGCADFDEFGTIQSNELRGRTTMTARDLVVYGALLCEQFQKDLQSDDCDTYAARYRP